MVRGGGAFADWMRRRWSWLAVGALLGTLLIGTVERFAETSGVARVTVVPTPSGLPGDHEPAIEIEGLLAAGDDVIGLAAATISPPISADDLDRSVDVEARGPALIVEARGDTGSEAEARAIAVARAYVDHRTRDLEHRRDAAARMLADELASADPDGRAALRMLLEGLAIADMSGARITDVDVDGGSPGRGGAVPVGLVAGALVGAVVAAAGAVIAERFSSTLHSSRRVGATIGAPVLARVTRRSVEAGAPTISDRPSSPDARAHRELMAAVLGQLRSRGADSLLVISPDRTPARALLAANLGLAMEESGTNVVLVAGDRHRSDLDHAFDAVDLPGLSQVLSGDREVAFAAPRPGLRIMPSGRSFEAGDGVAADVVPDPSRISVVMDAGASWADVVIVDAPPSPSFPDGHILSTVVDAALVVATAGLTRRSDLATIRARLEATGVAVIGAVLVAGPPRRRVAPNPAIPSQGRRGVRR